MGVCLLLEQIHAVIRGITPAHPVRDCCDAHLRKNKLDHPVYHRGRVSDPQCLAYQSIGRQRVGILQNAYDILPVRG